MPAKMTTSIAGVDRSYNSSRRSSRVVALHGSVIAIKTSTPLLSVLDYPAITICPYLSVINMCVIYYTMFIINMNPDYINSLILPFS